MGKGDRRWGQALHATPIAKMGQHSYSFTIKPLFQISSDYAGDPVGLHYGEAFEGTPMTSALGLEMEPQPDDSTCGPTCLHALYRYYGDSISLEDTVREAGMLSEGGTLAVLLGCHALRRGYEARIYTYNLQVFDPTWFRRGVSLRDKLLQQAAVKNSAKLTRAADAYVEFLDLGGEIRMEVLTIGLIRRYLQHETPILTGLSATFLYGEAREIYVPTAPIGRQNLPDDIRGYPAGHFVVLCGYDPAERQVDVADPLDPNPLSTDRHYAVAIDRVFCAIMLGIVTYDANLLIVRPRNAARPVTA